MGQIFFKEENQNNRGEHTPPPKKSFDFNLYKKNTLDSLHDVEHFLNHFQHYSKCFKLFKILRK